MTIFDNMFACLAAAAAVVSGFSIFMERRRHKRKDLNKVGFMPWNLLSVIAILGVVIMSALAIKYG